MDRLKRFKKWINDGHKVAIIFTRSYHKHHFLTIDYSGLKELELAGFDRRKTYLDPDIINKYIKYYITIGKNDKYTDMYFPMPFLSKQISIEYDGDGWYTKKE